MSGAAPRVLALMVAFGVSFAAERVALAADAKAEARRHYEAGEALFKAGRFAEALAEHEAGYKVQPLPGFLINVAHCYRLMGELRRARANYRKFLLVQPTSPRRKEVEDMIVELDKAIVEAEGPGPAVKVGPQAVGDSAAERKRSVDLWLWSAIAGVVLGPLVATLTLAEEGGGR